MKRINYLLNGFAALVIAVLFAQCADNQKNTQSAVTHTEGESAVLSGMKLAYVEIDTLLTQYNFWNELNEIMMKKEESIRATLNQRATELDNEVREFQRKYENNAFVSMERAQQEQSRLMKKQQDLQELSDRLQRELAAENQKNSIELRDSINSFLIEYNKTKGYSMIISNTGFDNLLYADPAYNITQEIVEGLNARYSPSSVKK